MLATLDVTCHCLEKNPQEKTWYSVPFSPPSTSAFCTAWAKTVYSIMCPQEEVVRRPNFIIVKRNDLRNRRDLGVLSVESLLTLLSSLFFQSQASLGLLSHVKQFGFLLEECCVCQAQREPRGMDLLSCLPVVVHWDRFHSLECGNDRGRLRDPYHISPWILHHHQKAFIHTCASDALEQLCKGKTPGEKHFCGVKTRELPWFASF